METTHSVGAERTDSGCVVAILEALQTREGRQHFMNGTYWSLYTFVFGCLVAFMVMRRSGQISKKEATDYVKDGAAVVDVRSAREFNSGHLSQAFNVPLDDLQTLLPERIKDKNRVILVHCRTGLNSKKAKEILLHKRFHPRLLRACLQNRQRQNHVI
jgi:phage shock protein E